MEEADEEDVLLNKLSRISHEYGDDNASKLFSSFSKSLDVPVCKHCQAPIFNSRVRIRKKFILSLYCSSCSLVSLLKLKKTIKNKKKSQLPTASSEPKRIKVVEEILTGEKKKNNKIWEKKGKQQSLLEVAEKKVAQGEEQVKKLSLIELAERKALEEKKKKKKQQEVEQPKPTSTLKNIAKLLSL